MDARIVRRPAAPVRAVSVEENSDLARQLAFHPSDLKALRCPPPAPPRRGPLAAATEAPSGSPNSSGFSNPAPSLQVVCPGCRKELKARIELAGKTGKCPSCGHLLAIRPVGPVVDATTALVNMPPVIALNTVQDAAASRGEPDVPIGSRDRQGAGRLNRFIFERIALTMIAPALVVGLFFALRGLSTQADQFGFVGLYSMFVLIIFSFFTAAKLFTGLGGYTERL